MRRVRTGSYQHFLSTVHMTTDLCPNVGSTLLCNIHSSPALIKSEWPSVIFWATPRPDVCSSSSLSWSNLELLIKSAKTALEGFYLFKIKPVTLNLNPFFRVKMSTCAPGSNISVQQLSFCVFVLFVSPPRFTMLLHSNEMWLCSLLITFLSKDPNCPEETSESDFLMLWSSLAASHMTHGLFWT